MAPYDPHSPFYVAQGLARADEVIHQDLLALIQKACAETRNVLSRRDVQLEAGIGQTNEIAKEQSGVLRTVRDGVKVLVTVASFYEFLVERLIASHPVGAPTMAAPKGEFRKRKRPYRPRTEAELAGLRAGNERRQVEAAARRRAQSRSSAEVENTG
jgi:hypothetical protein